MTDYELAQWQYDTAEPPNHDQVAEEMEELAWMATFERVVSGR